MLKDITILDFETTGLNPAQDQVIEMAALRVINGKERHEFQCLVNVGITLPAKITELTGIETMDLEDGLPERIAFAILRNLIGESVIVAHNAAFDLAFLHHTYLRLGSAPLTNPFLCTRTAAAFRYPKPYSLESLTARFGIVNDSAHRAMSDVKATWALLQKFEEAADCDEFLNVMGYVKYYGAPAWVPEYATMRGY